MNRILKLIEKVENNRVETEKKIAEIRKDITLSANGKGTKLSKVFSEGKLEHKRLMQEYKLAKEGIKKDLIRDIYLHPIAMGMNTDNQIKEMRELVERAELAYKNEEIESLTDRAIGMRDKSLIRAIGSVAYAQKDFTRMEKLETIDRAVSEALEYERGFGELATYQKKVGLNMIMRGIEEPAEVSQSVKNALM